MRAACRVPITHRETYIESRSSLSPIPCDGQPILTGGLLCADHPVLCIFMHAGLLRAMSAHWTGTTASGPAVRWVKDLGLWSAGPRSGEPDCARSPRVAPGSTAGFRLLYAAAGSYGVLLAKIDGSVARYPAVLA